MPHVPVVSVYGSAGVSPDHPTYREAEQLGRLLAGAGYAVQTGGYAGVMEAASKGAHLAGGHVIGVTVGLFERSGHRSGPNPYIDELVRYDLLSERLLHVVKHCDAAVACGGGIGTLSEIMLLWSLVQTGEKPRVPIVLLGERWRQTIETFIGDGAYIRDGDLSLVSYASTPAGVLDILNGSRR